MTSFGRRADDERRLLRRTATQNGFPTTSTTAILLRRDRNNAAGEWNEPAAYRSVRRQKQLLVRRGLRRRQSSKKQEREAPEHRFYPRDLNYGFARFAQTGRRTMSSALQSKTSPLGAVATHLTVDAPRETLATLMESGSGVGLIVLAVAR